MNNLDGNLISIMIVAGISLFLAVFLVVILKKKRKSFETCDFDELTGEEFEEYCAYVLEKAGFENVEITKGSADRGIDILAEKDDITYAIQCKCYGTNIGNHAIQEAYSGKGIYDTDVAVVLTNSYFTRQAIEDAKKLHVHMWDRDKLLSLRELAFDNK